MPGAVSWTGRARGLIHLSLLDHFAQTRSSSRCGSPSRRTGNPHLRYRWCWIVADGNNRVGLILKKNREATIADIPERLLATARFGEWDAEMMDWWNPCARSFGEVMGKGKKARAPKNSIYGIIERDGEGKFVASTHALKKGVTASAIGHTADEAKRLLEDKLKIMFDIPIRLKQVAQLLREGGGHGRHRPA